MHGVSMCRFSHVTDPFSEVCLHTFGPYLPSQPPWSAFEHLTSLARSARLYIASPRPGSRPICSSKHSIAPLSTLVVSIVLCFKHRRHDCLSRFDLLPLSFPCLRILNRPAPATIVQRVCLSFPFTRGFSCSIPRASFLFLSDRAYVSPSLRVPQTG